MRKFIFALIVFLVAFAVPVTVYILIAGPPEEFDTREEAAEGGEVMGNTSIPQIISVPVTEVSAGEQYSYRVRAIDEDGDTLEYEARLYPSWMTWDEELQVLEGTPGSDDVGLHRVEIVITDGKWVQTHAFDVSVTDDGTESVVPVSDSLAGSVTATSGSDQDASDWGGGTDDGSEGQDPSMVDESQDSADLEEYGLIPIDDTISQAGSGTADASARPAVLGEATTLPNTASFNGILAVALGIGVIFMGIFLWSDARWDISDRLMAFIRYERGEQIGMDMKSGSKVKKRKIQL